MVALKNSRYNTGMQPTAVLLTRISSRRGKHSIQATARMVSRHGQTAISDRWIKIAGMTSNHAADLQEGKLKCEISFQ